MYLGTCGSKHNWGLRGNKYLCTHGEDIHNYEFYHARKMFYDDVLVEKDVV